jgi:hypothetical protein
MTGARFTLGLVGYAHHDLLDRPPGDTSLWRFLDFAKFVDMLDRETLFFARADTMIDPWEGRIGDGGHGKIPAGGHRDSPLADMSSPR